MIIVYHRKAALHGSRSCPRSRDYAVEHRVTLPPHVVHTYQLITVVYETSKKNTKISLF